MIHHCVWIRFRTDINQQTRDGLLQEIADLVGVIPGLQAVHRSRNARFEDLDHGFEDGFIAVFDNRTALQAYQDHPAHQATGKRLVESAQGGLQGLLVFDLVTEMSA